MNSSNRFGPAAIAEKLNSLDGRSFTSYQELADATVVYDSFSVHFLHIQNSPGADPASAARLTVPARDWLPGWAVSSPVRKMASEDFILRAFFEGISQHCRQNRGADGSGSFQMQKMPQQVLERNIVRISPAAVTLLFRISLPGTRNNKIRGGEAAIILGEELPAVVEATAKKLRDHRRLRAFCDGVEDMLAGQEELAAQNLVAFIGDQALLPRESGVSDLPAQGHVIPFIAPEELAVTLKLPNAGTVRGVGVPAGVTVLIGGGFHGKSTLLNAMAMGIYPHVPGDGRQRVIANKNSVVISAEDGRSVTNLDISAFISSLPDHADPQTFATGNASGSTSEAAAIIENICAGAQVLLIDEDSSATNFLIRDRIMRELIPEDPIIPLFDRVRELYEQHGISTVIIAGGSSEYLGVADQVIAMRHYRPVSMTGQVQALGLPQGGGRACEPMAFTDGRRITAANFDPSYANRRLRKTVPVRIKPLRGQELRLLEYGQDLLDLKKLPALVDFGQLTTIGCALLLAREKLVGVSDLSPSELAAAVLRMIDREGLECLQPENLPPLFFTRVRAIELAGAINRLRSLTVSR